MTRDWLRRGLRFLLFVILGFVGLSVLLVLVFRVVPVFGSTVMLERKIESWVSGEPISIQQQWRPWASLSDNAKLAVIASEDQRFPMHHGFDFNQMQKALDAWFSGDSLRGASTISQQTAKNLFLWTGRTWVRKGFEAWFTVLIELLWPKERILEVYLNVVEWDSGVFGLEAAAQHYFGVGADRLTAAQASRLAAILPNPREWSASRPSAYIQQRSQWIQRQMRQLGGSAYLDRL
ncbi:monofunctional biosynthetic peptidoglycan transglycosylase [Chromohalobacter canadensis]|uniref:Biosynthetic peptidoglycan transglycosylase n=1 Tax=Chromohalobacter moromii TaxID=2860329 RepID=A0A9X2X0N5_9GAMM|nr:MULTISPECIES: monofunctional biosynthetic peptidoglycan transglycosylase [Chromohalobacter]MCT8467483.1 monofunctional biosynthetic peptidoglycan transglycosylase [Chromohalobacter canadensis]MCT8470769.1 monofunctional biosynthetic peptidoglycan transglycosylase [Chromohalobacter canadensis]MCT8497980.1 monofunctional biosynthetic peptidoglycan transglycosylase [Chromohalobacter canadensis]MCT8504336.1 monofunctional biosynthetic peptidoglycan transglycosylase [Chromohalobacter moromii]